MTKIYQRLIKKQNIVFQTPNSFSGITPKIDDNSIFNENGCNIKLMRYLKKSIWTKLLPVNSTDVTLPIPSNNSNYVYVPVNRKTCFIYFPSGQPLKKVGIV